MEEWTLWCLMFVFYQSLTLEPEERSVATEWWNAVQPKEAKKYKPDRDFKSIHRLHKAERETMIQMKPSERSLEEDVDSGDAGEKGKKPSPELRSNFVSRLFFMWMDGLLWQGYRNPLQLNDLYNVNPRFESKGLAESSSSVPILANAMTPLVLQAIITYISKSSGADKPPVWQGYVYALILFCLNMYATVGISFSFQRVSSYGMSIRATMTDLVRLDLAVVFFHLTWTFLFQILLIIGLLIRTIGASALAGFALLCAFVPLQAVIIRKIEDIRTNIQFSWENSFLDRIVGIRTKELVVVVTANILRSLVTAAGFAVPALAAALTFMVYYAVDPSLDLSSKTLKSPYAITVSNGSFYWEGQTRTSSDEKKEEKKSEEVEAMSENIVTKRSEKDDDAQKTFVGSFHGRYERWDINKDDLPSASPHKLAIKDINLQIPIGALVAIVGTVGSGKTSLLSALVGALKAEDDAKVVFSGSVGYVPQQAWIMNSTLKDNILFGLPFDRKRYEQAIDESVGINLSGGQKQRVSLARLVYFNSSIVLLDDPLSAVDAHVGKHIFHKCIKGALEGKTRILVTHQLHFVPQCDIVITMKDGAVAEYGTYADLMTAKHTNHMLLGEFAKLMKSYGGITDEPEVDEKSVVVESESEEEKEAGEIVKEKKTGAAGGQLMQAEERMTGQLSNSVIVTFAIALGGRGFILLLLSTLALTQLTRIANDLWLVYWTSRSVPGLSGLAYLWIYLGFGLAQAVTLLSSSPLAELVTVYTARELKRMDALTRSPLYAHISESIADLQFTAQRWLGMRLEIIGNILVLVTSLFCAIERSPNFYPCVFVSILKQRFSLYLLNDYTIMRAVWETEAAEVIEATRPPKEWPVNGAIELKDMSLKYQEDLPLVLKNVTLAIKSHEKIGVVGRTGSGKSSLMLALFRIVEPVSGQITIDGIATETLGLKDLRSRISIIPQDPILFSGTIRSNLDPFNEFIDADIWDSLSRSGMKEAVSAMEGGLEAPVHAGGENLSVGQRQLLCLARAMVRKPKLVVLDECTANVDLETDHQIQQSLRENLKDATILTIAHRLNTVIDYDRILVLDQGEIAEFDSPAALLARDGRDGLPQSIFSALVDETGAANSAALRAIAINTAKLKETKDV
ncbi:P-loop containing nucleoside triphosphate hydrolase protein [Chytridium lagenaria]|nr:P-loop containing nucleoside triphosphate hydrolase protein [Chytridium lagenaria]